MKKHFTKTAIILAALLVLGGLISCATTKANSEKYDARPIVCLGDSVTDGYQGFVLNNAMGPDGVQRQYAYPTVLGTRLKVPVLNISVTGITTTRILTDNANAIYGNPGTPPLIMDAVTTAHPQAVVIIVGANDFTGASNIEEATSSGYMKNVENNFVSIITRIQKNADEAGESVRFFIGGEFGSEDPEVSNQAYILTQRWGTTTEADLKTAYAPWRAMLQSLSAHASLRGSDIEYIGDIFAGGWGTNTEANGWANPYMSDSLHPNTEGYVIVANNVFNATSPWLKKAGLIK
jgi:lysophospholipase L1-like esterase